MMVLFELVMMELPARVTGADAGNTRGLAPVTVILLATVIPVALFVKMIFVSGELPPTAPPNVIVPVPGVKVSAVAPLIVLVEPEKVIFWLPALLSRIGAPEIITGPVIVIAPDVVVVILPLILMAVVPT